MVSLENGAILTRARMNGGAFLLPPSLWLEVTGPDALRYLNSQITADLRKISLGHVLKACLLTPKGRLIALLNITKQKEEAFIIETDLSLRDTVLERLQRYLVTDEVTIKIISQPQSVHVFGDISTHAEINEMTGTLISRLGVSGKDVELSLLSSLPMTAHTSLLSADMIEILRIEKQIPSWGFDITSETLPPEARLEKDYIDYEKGCYLGQEVISRLKSVGHVNRLLYGFISKDEITANMDIYSLEDSEKSLGKITSAALQYDSKQSIALGYLRRGAEDISFLVARDIDSGRESSIAIRNSLSPF